MTGLVHMRSRVVLPAKRKLVSLLPLAVAFSWVSCGGGDEPVEATAEMILARDRAADEAARARWPEAYQALAPLVERGEPALEDLLRAANTRLAEKEASDRVEKARPLVERAARLAPEDPVVLWCQYRLAAIEYDLPRAIEVLRRLEGLRPGDYTVRLALASALDDFEEPAAESEAQSLYRKLLEVPVEHAGSWRLTVLYRLAQSLVRSDQAEAANPLFEEKELLEGRGLAAPGVPEHEPDTLGAVQPHTPAPLARPAPTAAESRFEVRELAPAGSFSTLCVAQLDGNPQADVSVKHDADREEVYTFAPQTTILVAGPKGAAHAQLVGGLVVLDATQTLDLVPFDRRNHGADKSSDVEKKKSDRDLDLLVARASGGVNELALLENVGGSWSTPSAALAELGGPLRLFVIDYDHDGDVDLLAGAATGLWLLRNDGLDGTGGFADATAEAGLPQGDFQVVIEDLDRDNDVDLLLVERAGGKVRYLSNERAGRFAEKTAELPAGLCAKFLVAADFDGDSWVDLAAFGAELVVHARSALGGWHGEPRRFALAAAPIGEPRAVDWDLDGACDLLWPTEGRVAAGLLAPGLLAGGVPFELGDASPGSGPASVQVADLDGDCDLDLVRLDAGGLRAYLTQGRGQGTPLALLGHKDNARGLGAIVELRSGREYRRLYYRGAPELVGFSGKTIDVVRITWPNGVVQGNFDFAPREPRLIAQRQGQVGSCPFLYTWNGTTYEFISDVLGITPLGLPMAPGMPGSKPMMVPPDHDEYVLVKGEQLVPKEGFYELHLTEELREVTYLDRIRLDVVDHPSEVEVFPNERFSFPPFPEAHTHTVKDPLVPLSARDQDGRDWKDELTHDDRRFALPFEPLTGPYRGLATPHTLELAFEPERVRAATKLRLFLNGWFYWTDASVNVAVARHPDFEFVPPILSVPDGKGGWRECGPIGFPAGKLKTMAVDVTELLNRADPRIRLASTLRLYWDSIRLATDADEAPFVTTALEPVSAHLWQRGFSRSFALLGDHDCEWFTWDELEPAPRWNQHPGLYTKLGETLPLVGAIDDQFVIMGAGDALTVRFDARALPPLPAGWRRDYLVFLDGWAKDRDPNTLEALNVEPLPFHGMSGFPYGPGWGEGADERYPVTEEHCAYRREWNTRPATRWIEPLSPDEVFSERAKATNAMPANSKAPAATTGSVKRSPSTKMPAAPATSG
jgi:Flp pilus assembly protein TadD